MDACKVYRLGTVKVEYSATMEMESLAYENAIPVDVGPPPLRGDVWLLGRRYSLPRGAYTHKWALLRHLLLHTVGVW